MTRRNPGSDPLGEEHSLSGASCPNCGGTRTYFDRHHRTWRCNSCKTSFRLHAQSSPPIASSRKTKIVSRLRNARFSRPLGIILVLIALCGGIAYSYLATDVFSRNDNQYHGYYFGLVKTDDGVLRGSGCYDNEGDFILLINNKKAKNPAYMELLDFLRDDDTSELPYHYVHQLPSYYYSPEDRVSLDIVKAIVDGTTSPTSPNMYADFAERLHNNAEIAGIRCGYVYLEMTDYTDPQDSEISSNLGHACNVFDTTDMGRIYIDDTGSLDADGPPNRDMIVDIVEVGQPYNPRILFPSDEWIVPSGQMGTVADIFVTWDGDWNNKWLR